MLFIINFIPKIALEQSDLPMMIPAEIPISDSRAHKLFVTYCYGSPQESTLTSAADNNSGWFAIPFPESFSRHSGTCLILGDRQTPSIPFILKTGDCFRLGIIVIIIIIKII